MQQYNPIRFFTSKTPRQWDITPNNVESMVFYQLGIVPAISLLYDTSPDSGLPTVTAKIYNSEDSEVYEITNITVENKDYYGQINFSSTFAFGMLLGSDQTKRLIIRRNVEKIRMNLSLEMQFWA